ncbi:ribosome biogenesis GTP-binding protein YihA/YsxC [Bacteroidota bacterium]
MIIKKVSFIKSSTKIKDCPSEPFPEYAFTGRSNVGKSSLINMICNRTKLAKTSSTPGKTQLINHFLINDSWYLVDLPGYGYAKMPVQEREKMMKMIRDYVLKSQRLVCLFLLIDIRLKMQDADKKFLSFLGENEVPFVLVFTKTDKVSKNQLSQNLEQYKNTLLKTWEFIPDVFLSSALKNTGREEILDFIQKTLDRE